MKKLLILMVLALCCCESGVEPDSKDRRILDLVEKAWAEQHDLPPAPGCLDYAEIRRHATQNEFADECDGMHPGLAGDMTKVKGCLTGAFKGIMGRRYRVINLSPEHHEDFGLIQHEALHAMVDCGGLQPASDPWDGGHRNPLVWSGAGGPASVQGRALAGLEEL